MQKLLEYSMISMTEVQFVLARLFTREGVTPVQLGTVHVPQVAIVPWHLYLAWWEALWRAKECSLIEEMRSRTNAARMFTSYRRELEPLLTPEKQALRVVVVKARDREVGALLAWADWMRFAPVEAPAPASEVSPAEDQRSYGIVFAHKHLSQFATQFAEEEARGERKPIAITKQGEPIMALLPWPLYEQWQALLAQIETGVASQSSSAPALAGEPSPPWPVGTAVQLSRDGLAIYDEAHEGEVRPFAEGAVFYILGVVSHFVDDHAYEDEASPHYAAICPGARKHLGCLAVPWQKISLLVNPAYPRICLSRIGRKEYMRVERYISGAKYPAATGSSSFAGTLSLLQRRYAPGDWSEAALCKGECTHWQRFRGAHASHSYRDTGRFSSGKRCSFCLDTRSHRDPDSPRSGRRRSLAGRAAHRQVER
ncbi:MAG TPA: hypothetical protein VFV38_01370 [Ktedonobacteraceae bacterium]|nr:hypothetical protein [Ktedonobacteraceae bacterium]